MTVNIPTNAHLKALDGARFHRKARTEPTNNAEKGAIGDRLRGRSGSSLIVEMIRIGINTPMRINKSESRHFFKNLTIVAARPIRKMLL